MESNTRKHLKLHSLSDPMGRECQTDVDQREVGPTGNNQAELTEQKNELSSHCSRHQMIMSDLEKHQCVILANKFSMFHLLIWAGETHISLY